jgi:tellurite methyltransferase
MKSPWARRYLQTPDSYIWGTAPSGFAREVAELLPSGARVLELGCGEGRDSVFFGSLGFDVTGVDSAAAGIEKAERLASARGVSVRWVRGDMATVTLEGPFDLVYSCGAVHYVPRAERNRLLDAAKTLTRPGGLHAHIVFTDREIYVELDEVIDYFLPGELLRCYGDWSVLVREEGAINCSQDGTPHRHSVEKLIARCPAER